MKRIFRHYMFPGFLVSVVCLTGCKKQNDFLNAKPNQGLAIPSNLNDMQLLLNNENIFSNNYPSLGEISSDDFYVPTGVWNSVGAIEQNTYIWAKQIYPANSNVGDWNFSYQQVYYANSILSGLVNIPKNSGNTTQYNKIQGGALFYRAIAFYNLLQTFSMPFDPKTSSTDLGIPLRLSTDLNAKVNRSTVSKCFDQIESDLNSALPLLPDLPGLKTQPSKAAVFGLLSRIYLVLGDYQQSLDNANNFLKIYNTLQDFNKLDPTAYPVYANYSPEEVFHSSLLGYSIEIDGIVDSTVYRSFNNPNDLRPSLFFYNYNGDLLYNSQYDQQNNISSTISTNEMYLNKAECEARLNNQSQAMQDLNTLLITRWKAGTFVPYSATSADNALIQILSERRKELLFTGLRWSDLRRLNKDTRFAITLYRNINGVTYSLPPNDIRYALPIPDNEIALNPIPQNPR